ncbi:hypothetical protein OAW23_00215 [Flavobacteriales bacterium]|nr:hypothetical protein [Flavobacteriales bacterium]
MKCIVCCILALLSFITITSCNSDGDSCNPDLICTTVSIDSNWVNLSITEQLSGVPIALYNGNLEDNLIVLRDTLYGDSYDYYLPTGIRYTAEAYYRSGPNIIIAVDSKKLTTESFTNCDDTCYESDEITLDLVLIE